MRSEELARDGDETKGFYGWDMDQRALEAAPNNQHIQDFVNQNGSAEAIAKMQEYMSGEKSASLPENYYELTETFNDGTSQTTYFTKGNHKELLEEMNIADFEKEGIESMFK